jgi:hypothetical protein
VLTRYQPLRLRIFVTSLTSLAANLIPLFHSIAAEVGNSRRSRPDFRSHLFTPFLAGLIGRSSLFVGQLPFKKRQGEVFRGSVDTNALFFMFGRVLETLGLNKHLNFRKNLDTPIISILRFGSLGFSFAGTRIALKCLVSASFACASLIVLISILLSDFYMLSGVQ